MAEIVSKGFTGGHYPTRGFYNSLSNLKTFLYSIEAQIGITPIIRVRIDLDGDGVFEVVEKNKLSSIGSVSRAIEWLTNKPRFGSANFSVKNDDLRWSEFFPKSLIYSIGVSPIRYHFKNCIIELGFDGIENIQDTSWYPLFYGYIESKNDNANNRTVSFNLLDEWTRILSYDLYTTANGREFLTAAAPNYYYYSDSDFIDNREIGLGTYWGKHSFLPAEYTSKDNQVLIPFTHNLDWMVGASSTIPYFKSYKPYRFLKLQIPDNHTTVADIINNFVTDGDVETDNKNHLYFWGWDRTWFTDDKPKWLKVYKEHDGLSDPQYTVRTLYNQNVHLSLAFDSSQDLKAYDSLGNLFTLTEAQLLDTTNQDFVWDWRLDCSSLESNPAKILYRTLQQIGVSDDMQDASSDDVSTWQDIELDYDDPNYYSYDVSSTYLDRQKVKLCVNIKDTTTLQSLVESICEMTRGSLFIDKGKDISDTNYVPIRRIHFVIHQPRMTSFSRKILTASRIRSLETYRDTQDIRNEIEVNYFNYNSTSKFTDKIIATVSDSASINAYGNKKYVLGGKVSNICFLYDALYYASFLAQHYLSMYKEPILRAEVTTDIIGYLWDLKSLIGIQEADYIGFVCDTALKNLNGLMEVYDFRYNIGSHEIQLSCKWAGYLIAPGGDIENSRWGFWDNMYWDEEIETELSYFYW